MNNELKDKFLEARDVTGGYGSGPDILHACNISVDKGEIVVIVGPNGAGKSTAMKAIFGMLNMRDGSILLDGEDISGLTTQDRVRAGMGFVPQNQNIFTSMTVEENLEMGAFIRKDDFQKHWNKYLNYFLSLKIKEGKQQVNFRGGKGNRLPLAEL